MATIYQESKFIADANSINHKHRSINNKHNGKKQTTKAYQNI